MSFIDKPTTLTEPELDQEKRRAVLRMVGVRDAFIWNADCAASHLYNEAHVAILTCRTEGELAQVEEGFKGAVKVLQERLDGPR